MRCQRRREITGDGIDISVESIRGRPIARSDGGDNSMNDMADNTDSVWKNSAVVKSNCDEAMKTRCHIG